MAAMMIDASIAEGAASPSMALDSSMDLSSPMCMSSPALAFGQSTALLLPTGALSLDGCTTPQATCAGASVPTPIHTPQCTTAWRTVTCPYAPVKRMPHKQAALSDASAASTPSGLATPPNVWPTPTSTPMNGCVSPGLMPPATPTASGPLMRMISGQDASVLLRGISGISHASGWSTPLACHADDSISEDCATPDPGRAGRSDSMLSPVNGSPDGPETPEEKLAAPCNRHFRFMTS
eukprot:NODE_12213_length_1238_cov_15.835284.p1 GENE.NODE_12213_length_1238_cov_15.835284~~NODE_12213_length_1238_cov_15.835284.p1  ORF type:complete len:237 (-),score=60.65 NODE_12213_length_1238_cov_15.835284:433-1143(-)